MGIWSEFIKKHGTQKDAAEALGINTRGVQRHLQLERAIEVGQEPPASTRLRTVRTPEQVAARLQAQRGNLPDLGLVREVPDGLDLQGVSITYDKHGDPARTSIRMGLTARDPAEAIQLPSPGKITKISTNYNKQGDITSQWVQERPEDRQRDETWKSFAQALAVDLPRAEMVQSGKVHNSDLCSCYILADHHFGMYSWKPETGADYDLVIAENLLDKATTSLVDSVPPSEWAVLAVLGDICHFDSLEPVTPAHKNLLDADGRAQKMIQVTVRALRNLIIRIKKKHKKVHIIFEPGNHDPYSIIFLGVMFSALLENDPDISVESRPGNFHYFEFGKNLIGTHHGHSAKMEKLPGIMAHDQAEAWGRTKYRTFLTGHIHHEQVKEFPGCTVESFGILAAPDAYAANHGYRSKRSMKAIVLHRENGEVERHTVNPDMIA